MWCYMNTPEGVLTGYRSLFDEEEVLGTDYIEDLLSGKREQVGAYSLADFSGYKAGAVKELSFVNNIVRKI